MILTASATLSQFGLLQAQINCQVMNRFVCNKFRRVKRPHRASERDRIESGKLHQARGVFHFTLCNCSCLARFTLASTRNFVVIFFFEHLLNISPRIFACSFSNRNVAVVVAVVTIVVLFFLLLAMFYKSFELRDRSCWVKGAYKFLKLPVACNTAVVRARYGRVRARPSLLAVSLSFGIGYIFMLDA